MPLLRAVQGTLPPERGPTTVTGWGLVIEAALRLAIVLVTKYSEQQKQERSDDKQCRSGDQDQAVTHRSHFLD